MNTEIIPGPKSQVPGQPGYTVTNSCMLRGAMQLLRSITPCIPRAFRKRLPIRFIPVRSDDLHPYSISCTISDLEWYGRSRHFSRAWEWQGVEPGSWSLEPDL
jgi:hypothetical protein